MVVGSGQCWRSEGRRTTQDIPTKGCRLRREIVAWRATVEGYESFGGELHRVEREEVGWPRSSARSSKAGPEEAWGELLGDGVDDDEERCGGVEEAANGAGGAACCVIVLLQLDQRLPTVATSIGVGLAVNATQEWLADGGADNAADDRALRHLWRVRQTWWRSS
uniref:Uncharacterized protein n=1 Tax=Oryza meridionalis TaxID=40149 RepID=A0A0E0FAL1_9ORYZ